MNIKFGVMNGFATRKEAVEYAKNLRPSATVMELCEEDHGKPFEFGEKILGYFVIQEEDKA